MERRESGALRQEGRSGGERNSFGGGRSYGVTLIQIHSEKHKGTGKANRERVSRYSLEERLDQDCNTKWQGLSLWQRCSHKETFFQFADEQRRQAAKCTENGPGVLKQGSPSSVLEGRCPAEFSSNPNQTHLKQLIKLLLGILQTSRQVCWGKLELNSAEPALQDQVWWPLC